MTGVTIPQVILFSLFIIILAVLIVGDTYGKSKKRQQREKNGKETI